MIDAAATVFIGASLALILAAIVEFAALRREAKLALAIAAGAWVGLAGAVVAAGAPTSPVITLTLFGAPLLAAVVLALGSTVARRAAGAIPLAVLVGLNAVRVGGVAFVLLALDGRLAGPFPYFAGWGDFITGALAIPVAMAAAKSGANRRALLAWNAFGMLDLVVAVTLGLISRNGSPVQLIHAGVGTTALLHLPWAFVPTVLVPFFLVVHTAIFARVASANRFPARPLAAARELGQAHR